ncbi:MAG: hypothetical protein LBM98_12565 [Oscillospiraceae bacterium]|nr:hypothetical protein [Oscillospiraceae bacterium]
MDRARCIARHCEAAESLRYVPLISAKQSSAAVRRYVCYAPGTGLLRTCNTVRIVGLPVLRNDGSGRFADRGAAQICSANLKTFLRFGLEH